MRSLALIALTLVVLAATTTEARGPKHYELSSSYTFDKYVADFGKAYKKDADPAEYNRRAALFAAELKAVMQHNADKSQTYKKGINQFSDWTETEKAKRLRGHKQSLKQKYVAARKSGLKTAHKGTAKNLQASGPVPRFVDYRNSVPAVLTAVKDQGQCGSCWAHAATESIESYYALSTGKLYTLSQQQISSCTPNPNQCGGSGGCNGAIAELAFDYITFNQGITSEWMYPYTTYWGQLPACAFNQTTTIPQVLITGYSDVGHNDHNALESALAFIGPVAVSVDASGWGSYEGGIFSGCSYAANISMDHAVQAVGYGHDFASGLDYWVVRNSWSPDWGENGFIKLLKSKEGSCGWNVNPQNGDGCKGQTAPEWACGMCGIAYDGIYPNVSPNFP